MSNMNRRSRASVRCAEGHGFDSCRGLRFFLCPMPRDMMITSCLITERFSILYFFQRTAGMVTEAIACTTGVIRGAQAGFGAPRHASRSRPKIRLSACCAGYGSHRFLREETSFHVLCDGTFLVCDIKT